MINTVRTFGIALVESQHNYFSSEIVDNSEHIPAIERIADTAFQYLIANDVSSETAIKVKNDLINHGKDLFIKLWMQNMIEDGETPHKKDTREAEKTFDKLLKVENRNKSV